MSVLMLSHDVWQSWYTGWSEWRGCRAIDASKLMKNMAMRRNVIHDVKTCKIYFQHASGEGVSTWPNKKFLKWMSRTTYWRISMRFIGLPSSGAGWGRRSGCHLWPVFIYSSGVTYAEATVALVVEENLWISYITTQEAQPTTTPQWLCSRLKLSQWWSSRNPA